MIPESKSGEGVPRMNLADSIDKLMENIISYKETCEKHNPYIPNLTKEEFISRKMHIDFQGYNLYKENEKIFNEHFRPMFGQWPGGELKFTDDGIHERVKLDRESVELVRNFARELAKIHHYTLAAELWRAVIYYTNDFPDEVTDDLKLRAVFGYAHNLIAACLPMTADMALPYINNIFDTIRYEELTEIDTRHMYIILMHSRIIYMNTNVSAYGYDKIFSFIKAGLDFTSNETETGKRNREQTPELPWDEMLYPMFNVCKYLLCLNHELYHNNAASEKDMAELADFIEQDILNEVGHDVYGSLTKEGEPLPEELMKQGDFCYKLNGWAAISYNVRKSINIDEYMSLIVKIINEITKTVVTVDERMGYTDVNDANRLCALIESGGILGKYHHEFNIEKKKEFSNIADQIIMFFNTQPMESFSNITSMHDATINLIKLSSKCVTLEDYITQLQNINFHNSISTYAHCETVAAANVNIIKHLFEFYPEMLVGLCGVKTVEDVLGRKEKEPEVYLAELVRWAELSGRAHDIGKIDVMATIEQHTYPLTNLGFFLIRKHTDSGAKYFNQENLFENEKELVDCVLRCVDGHQEMYDGQGRRGYTKPGYGENSPSPYARLRSITQVNDVINAIVTRMSYTEQRNLKSALEVLEKGTQPVQGVTEFDPNIVEIILKDIQLHAMYNWCSAVQYWDKEWEGYLRFIQNPYDISIKNGSESE